MAHVIMLVGVAGSGKDTWINERLDELTDKNYVVHSSDDIREELFGGLVQDKNGVVFDTMKKRTLQSLNSEINVVYNATNINRKRRASLYREIKSKGHNVGIVIFTRPLAWLLRSNKERPVEKQVPEDVIKKMYINLQIPRKTVDCDAILVEGQQYFSDKIFDNYYECFDDILADTKDADIIEELMLNYQPHDTPYHLEDINKHITMTIEASKSPNMKLLALFHDLGKGICKNGGRYIGHENVGAVYMLNAVWFGGKTSTDLPEVIYQHMNAHRGFTPTIIDRNKLDEGTMNLATYFAKNIDGPSRVVKEDIPDRRQATQ